MQKLANHSRRIPVAVDPVFAAIADHKALVAAIGAFHVEDEGAKYQAACAAEAKALRELTQVKPISVPGAAALLEYLAEREGEFVDEARTGSPFLAGVRTIATALRGMSAVAQSEI